MRTTTSFVVRVTRESLALVVCLAIIATVLGGARGALGVVTGGALAVLDFWWLSGRVAAWSGGADRPRALWVLAANVRFVAVAALCAVVFLRGWVHPVALLAGLSVLPFAVITQGLRAARGPV